MGHPLYISNYIQYKNGKFISESPLKDEIIFTKPKEFGGEATKWTPTELFLAGLGGSIVQQLLMYSESHNIDILEVSANSSCKISNKEGRFCFEYITINISIKTESVYEYSRIEEIMQDMKSICPEANLLGELVKIEFKFK